MILWLKKWFKRVVFGCEHDFEHQGKTAVFDDICGEFYDCHTFKCKHCGKIIKDFSN